MRTDLAVNTMKRKLCSQSTRRQPLRQNLLSRLNIVARYSRQFTLTCYPTLTSPPPPPSSISLLSLQMVKMLQMLQSQRSIVFNFRHSEHQICLRSLINYTEHIIKAHFLTWIQYPVFLPQVSVNSLTTHMEAHSVYIGNLLWMLRGFIRYTLFPILKK